MKTVNLACSNERHAACIAISGRASVAAETQRRKMLWSLWSKLPRPRFAGRAEESALRVLRRQRQRALRCGRPASRTPCALALRASVGAG